MTDLPDPERAELEAQANILVEIETRARSFPLYYYKPIPALAAFHQSRARLRILAGGNRCGKSEINAVESAAFALGYRPWVLRELGLPAPESPWIRPATLPTAALCFNCEGIRVPVPNTVFVATGQPMKKGIGETMYPKLKKILGGFIESEHMAHSGVPSDLILKNGSKIVFGSAEQSNLAFESTNYTFNGIDEPVPRRVYTGIARGSIDQSAPIVMTFTPLGPWAAWIFRDLYSKARKGTDIEAFNCSIFDNPYLPEEAVRAFATDPAISEIEKQARLYGKFTHLSDRVYSAFDDRVHVVPSGYLPKHWYHGMVVDPHNIRPWAIAYFAASPNGDIYFHREWPAGDFTKIRRDDRSPEQYALLIRQLDGDLPIQVRLMDPNYGPRRDVIRGRHIESLQGEMSKFGLQFQCALNDDLAFGESQVRALLAFSPDQELSALNKPRLYFMENCPNLITSMNFYTAKAKIGAPEEADDEKRDETYKHFADLVRYVAVSQTPRAAQAVWEGIMGLDEAAPDYLGVSGYGE